MLPNALKAAPHYAALKFILLASEAVAPFQQNSQTLGFFDFDFAVFLGFFDFLDVFLAIKIHLLAIYRINDIKIFLNCA